MKITESRLRSIIRRELIKNKYLNEGLSDSLKSLYRKIFPTEDKSAKSEEPKSELDKFRDKLDKRYSLEMERYGDQRMVYLGPNKSPEAIPPNIMRRYAIEAYLDGTKSREEFLKKLPVSELDDYQQKEIKQALDHIDSEFKGKININK